MNVNRTLLYSLFAASAVFLGLLLIRPSEQQPDDLTAQLQQSASFEVETIQPSVGTLGRERVTSVLILPARSGEIPATTSGRVVRIVAPENTTVTRGEPVLELEKGELEARAQRARLAVNSAEVALNQGSNANVGDSSLTQARLTSAQANQQLAQNALSEARELFEIGAVAPSEISRLELELERATADLVGAREAAARSGRAPEESLELLNLSLEQATSELQSVEEALAASTIRAPYDGEVSELLVQEGEFISSGSPAFTLLSTDEQIVRFNVPPEVADQIFAEGELELSYAGQQFTAEPARRSSLSLETQLVEVEARINADEPLPNGAVTQLSFEAAGAQGLLLPVDAIRREDGSAFVLVAEDGHARRHSLSILSENDNSAAISGLDENANVIYPLPERLRDGSQISN